MRVKLQMLLAIAVTCSSTLAFGQSWQNVANRLPGNVSPTAPQLLSDGTVLFHN
jgi:hypothetical protein